MLNIEAAHAKFPEWLEAMKVCQARIVPNDSPLYECVFTPLAVAGGAVRDTLLGRSVKDIDVFYREPIIRTAGLKPMTATACKELVPTYEPKTDEEEYDDRLAVWDDGNGLQFIQVPDFQEDPIGNWIIQSFPCSLSEVWFDGVQLHMTSAFIKAVVKKQLVFKDNAKPGYVERIKAKYRDFAITRWPKSMHPIASIDYDWND